MVRATQAVHQHTVNCADPEQLLWASIGYRDLWFLIAWYNYRFLSLIPEIWVQQVCDESKTCQNILAMLQLEYSLAWPFFGTGMKTDLFQSCGHCWIFQICWLIECSTLTTLSFRIWNSSTGIPSPPLAWFIMMLPKAHLTLHFRLSGSRWVTPPWLSGSLRSFLYSSSVYSLHLLISSASVSFCPLLCSSLHEMFPWYL